MLARGHELESFDREGRAGGHASTFGRDGLGATGTLAPSPAMRYGRESTSLEIGRRAFKTAVLHGRRRRRQAVASPEQLPYPIQPMQVIALIHWQPYGL